VNAAETYANTTATVDVAAGTYTENDTVSVPAGDVLILEGAGATSTTADGGNSGSVFKISTGTVTIDSFTITNGSAPSFGGGIFNDGGAVTLTNDDISGNTAVVAGGGVENYIGSATLTNDTISNDSATQAGSDGGGVDSANSLTMTNDVISNDSTPLDGNGGGVNACGSVTLTEDTFSGDFTGATGTGYGGGALLCFSGTATVSDDTFSDDSAICGGGVYGSGTDTLTNDTFTNDTALSGEGGAVANLGGYLTVTNDTFANESGGGIYDDAATVVANSIFEAAGCSGDTPFDEGYNVDSQNSCGFGSTSIVMSTNINLGPLAANGSTGPETLAIRPGSSAFEEVPAADCTVPTDERGDPRPGQAGQNCDAGAYEYGGIVLNQSAPFSAKVAAGTGYHGHLRVTSASGTVTYTESASTDSTDVVVSSAGVITAPATLAPATYTVDGLDSDTAGHPGVWSFRLTVKPAVVTLIQGAPTSATVAYGAGYVGHLTVTNGNGKVTFTESVSADSSYFVVFSTGEIATSTTLPAGIYTVGGTDKDAHHDKGTWGFTLTVS